MGARVLWIVLGVLVLTTCMQSTASAQSPHLRISVSGQDSDSTPPRVTSGAHDRPTYNVQLRNWRLPLRQDASNYLSPYLLSHPRASQAIPVQMNFPVFMIREDPIVHLSLPSTQGYDEKVVYDLWSDPQRLSQKVDVQFRYLHNLVYVNAGIQHEQREGADATARSTRAAMMLLQVIDSLRHRTWYVVGQGTQDIVEKAINTLNAARGQGKICRWLGNATCASRDIDALVSRVRDIDSNHMTRIYLFIYPDNTAPSLAFCNERIEQISSFLDHIASAPNVSNPSSSRVAQELAACHTTRALCNATSVEYSIAELNAAEAALRRVTNHDRSWQSRLTDVQGARAALQDGASAVCPANRS